MPQRLAQKGASVGGEEGAHGVVKDWEEEVKSESGSREGPHGFQRKISPRVSSSSRACALVPVPTHFVSTHDQQRACLWQTRCGEGWEVSGARASRTC